ncbi:MAG: tetratricopeptide repeat protein [Deltaproteobacteria bacterium]|nr:tetratricopeptide repeat protein [Deltaproteobacteria bacterium]
MTAHKRAKKKTKPSSKTSNIPKTVAVCMIVKDEEKCLPAILSDIRPFADELIVVDTGSTDRTAEIAEKMGARVVFQAWTGDFGAARNRSIEEARSAWLMWLDADDRIEEADATRLRSLKQTLRSDCVYAVEVVNLTAQGPSPPFMQTRLFPNDPRLRFENRIHESITLAAKRQGFKTVHLPVRVVHTGYATPELMQQKLERNLAVLEEELAFNPDAVSIRFLYANTLITFNRIQEAQSQYEQITKTPGARNLQRDVFQGALVALADTHWQLKNYREAEKWAEQAAQDRPQNIQGWHQWGRALISLDRREEGLDKLKRALTRRNIASTLQVDYASIRLACLESAVFILVTLNRPQEAESLLNDAMDKDDAPRIYDLLGQLYGHMNRYDQALAVFRRAGEKYPALSYFEQTISEYEALMTAAQRDKAKAITAGQMHPEKHGVATADTDELPLFPEAELLEKAKELLNSQAFMEAGKIYVQIIQANPQSFEAFNGLGLVSWYLGKYGEAYDLFKKAADMHPADEEILLNLWDAAQKTGRAEEAKAVLSHAAAWNPGMTAIEELLNG